MNVPPSRYESNEDPNITTRALVDAFQSSGKIHQQFGHQAAEAFQILLTGIRDTQELQQAATERMRLAQEKLDEVNRRSTNTTLARGFCDVVLPALADAGERLMDNYEAAKIREDPKHAERLAAVRATKGETPLAKAVDLVGSLAGES